MKIIKKNVYYCEFCKKHWLRPCIKHEKICTANPNRECRLCKNKYNIELSKLVEKYKSSYETNLRARIEGRFEKELKITWRNNKPIKLEDIMDDAKGCPICTFSIIRLAGLNKFPLYITMNLEEEVKKYYNNEENEEGPCY